MKDFDRRLVRLARVLLITALGALPAPSVAKDDPSTSRVVQGVAIYFGVIPAQIVQGHSQDHPERTMHGGVPARAHRDHLVVALFDNASGKRIEDAEVSARVMEIGLAGQQRKLEPMIIAGTVTYGNYFDMPGRGSYHVQIQVRRPGAPGVIETQFDHRHVR